VAFESFDHTDAWRLLRPPAAAADAGRQVPIEAAYPAYFVVFDLLQDAGGQVLLDQPLVRRGAGWTGLSPKRGNQRVQHLLDRMPRRREDLRSARSSDSDSAHLGLHTLLTRHKDVG
jgi:hypothetical protein